MIGTVAYCALDFLQRADFKCMHSSLLVARLKFQHSRVDVRLIRYRLWPTNLHALMTHGRSIATCCKFYTCKPTAALWDTQPLGTSLWVNFQRHDFRRYPEQIFHYFAISILDILILLGGVGESIAFLKVVERL